MRILSAVTQVLSSAFFPLVPSQGRADPQLHVERQANHDALSPVRKAVLIGIKYAHGPRSMRVSGAYKDVRLTEGLLTESYGFRPEDITILMDNDEVKDMFKPTRENITRELGALVHGAQPGGAYFVLFSGHCEQLEEPESETGEYEEEDHLNECLVPMDAVRQQESEADYLDEKKLIVDDEVKSLLVDPIAAVPKARLTTLFDCCHSCTVLDLCHHRCNRTYNLKSKYRRIRRRLNEAFPESGKTILALIEPWTMLALERLHISIPATMKHTKFCDGYCSRINRPEGGNVLCISACKDSQLAFGNKKGGSLTRAFVKALKKDSHPALKDLYRSISAGVYSLVRTRSARLKFKTASQKPQFSSISPLV
ncbi:peptidase C14, caspase domain-containing protein [Armillaria nabsnona]|nr:peptidase C14, caspase domain-containing protein [Armillaria nabsnona]